MGAQALQSEDGAKRKRARGTSLLTAITIRNAKAPGWYTDGGGLYLEVSETGFRRWALRLTVNGKRRDFGLGSLESVSVQEAREKAAAYRARAQAGLDPVAAKAEAKAAKTAADEQNNVPTFREAAKLVHAGRKKAWSNGKHVNQWINTLEDHAFPMVGDLPVDKVGTPEVLKVLEPIWLEKPETARRVRQRFRTVLDWARAAGHRTGDNPVDLIGDALPRQSREGEHFEALPYSEVKAFVRKLREGFAEPVTKLAFEFLILTAARTIEVRFAVWSEFDLEAKLWTIPASRMKARREHVVPLSDAAVAVLKRMKKLRPAHGSDYVFPDPHTGKALSENRLLNARTAIGYKDRCTPHGFRSSFRDWAAEETNFPSEVVEMALAHSIRSKTEAAYRRGALLAKRRLLMEAWERYIS
jgi:integrase